MQTITEDYIKTITIPYIVTAGHGYIKISYYDLKGFNIKLNEFSNYSFYNSNNSCVYLEEDCDANKLVKLLKSKQIKVNFQEIRKDNFYPRDNKNFYYLNEVKEQQQ
tara:strand:- start:196 stop:516 length:321 start_codon:yes stop_codon:yes gene_type:complete